MATPKRTVTKRTKRSDEPPRGRPIPGFSRLTVHPDRMGGMPCIRDYRCTAAQVLRMMSAGHPEDEILAAYPYLERADLREALAFASRLAERRGEPFPAA